MKNNILWLVGGLVVGFFLADIAHVVIKKHTPASLGDIVISQMQPDVKYLLEFRTDDHKLHMGKANVSSN